jgi:tetratricopeptide (TPR) repeat protein
MTEAEFEVLLGHPEGPQLDFKRETYRLTGDGAGDLIKDVLSMANTPREGDSHVVIGVKKHPDGSYDLVGLPESPDDNEFQNAVKSKVHPCPVFLFFTITYQDKVFGIVRIKPERIGPCQATTDVGKVRRYVTYWRRGSQNDEARPDEQEIIRKWCRSGVPELTKVEIPADPQTPWERFLYAVHGFERERVYVLAVGPQRHPDPQRLRGLGVAPWNFVMDFDPLSSENGLAAAVHSTIRQNRALHEIALDDHAVIHVDRSCYWYYARGLSRRLETLVEDGWIAWRRKYGRHVQGQFRRLADGRMSRPVTVISMWSDEDYVRTVFDASIDVFGQGVDFVVASPDANGLARLRERYDATLIEISPEHLSEGIFAQFAPGPETPGNVILLPTRSGVAVPLSPDDRGYVEEEIEVVGLTQGTVADADREACTAFLRGREITWFELGLHCDVDREKAVRVLKVVRQDLGAGPDRRPRGTTRINLYHSPGAGGTTMGRRILWQMHLEYPCVVLHRAVPSETVDRLQTIHRLTGLPLLVLVEGAEVAENYTEDLFSLLRARQIPVVLLQVLRRFTQTEDRERSFFVDSQLSPVEATRFGYRLADARPQRRAHVLSLVARAGAHERSPFYLALETFEEHFEGLHKYVEARIQHATDQQKCILLFLSLAYHYGQQPIPAQRFSALLSLPPTLKVDFEKALPLYLRELIRRQSGNVWRPAHHLIAQELLRQLLAPNATDDRVWRQNLSTWAMKFAEFCRGDDALPSREMVELASRCFVFRDDRDLLGRETSGGPGQFSHLIEDIPVAEGRLALLLKLTDLFPDEAHFWAHLGRFYAIQQHDTEKAIAAIERAIQINPEDHVLYHMKGMALRSQAYQIMQQVDGEDPKSRLRKVLAIASQAAEQFIISRNKEPNEEHGYISHIQMLLRLVDFAKVALGADTVQQVLVNPTVDPALRESLDVAEDLLEQARRLREGDRPSAHVESCRNRLDAAYGRFDIVLRGWDNLLTRSDVYHPPVRRELVHTYLVRKERRWERLDSRELDRVLDLLESNIQEEPNEKKNIRLWMRAIRRKKPPVALETVIERVSYWKTNSLEIDAVYYLYVLYALQAMEGSVLALPPMNENVEECRRRARLRPNRTGSFEWVGQGQRLQRLVHYTELGSWDPSKDFWENAHRLSRLRGAIVSLPGPESGLIQLDCGMRVFFVPGKSGHVRGRDENRAVTLYLGFSYDGPRAWEVQNVS